MMFDTLDDFYSFWLNYESEVYSDAWTEFLSKYRKKDQPQSWKVMDAVKFVTLVRKAYNGTLNDQDRKLVDDYSLLIVGNFMKLWFNTVIVGHSSQCPIKFIQYEVLGDDMDNWNEKRYKRLSERCCDWIADDAFSDYGIEPLRKLMTPLMMQRNYSLKVQIMSEVISITHMRGDLSAFFVQNGKHTAFQIDVYEPDTTSSCY